MYRFGWVEGAIQYVRRRVISNSAVSTIPSKHIISLRRWALPLNALAVVRVISYGPSWISNAPVVCCFTQQWQILPLPDWPKSSVGDSVKLGTQPHLIRSNSASLRILSHRPHGRSLWATTMHQYNTTQFCGILPWDFWLSRVHPLLPRTSSALARFAQHILSTAEHAIFTSDLNPSDPFAYSSQMSFNLSLSNMPQSAKADMRFLGPRIGRISFV
jgi:hypothetical protein